ncbi:MAG: glutathione-disulfide reductase [Geminicoccaceae bacterium]|nr:MAG: glutathione-disulfide reductase [Geminicoccaceae bacterium]
MAFDYDLFVIGAGSGGVRAARIAAGHGARVGIAERLYYGGTCVNVGCVPKKHLTYAASYAHHFEDAVGYGWHLGGVRHDWKALIANKDKEIQRLNGVYERLLQNAGATIFWGDATLTGPHRLEVADREVTAERILIATGGRPVLPAVPGVREHGITSDDVFYLEAMPERIAIVGAGYIGIEFAGIFARLGAEVVLVHRGQMILNEGFDADARRVLQEEMAKQGVTFAFDCRITGVERVSEGLRVHRSTGPDLLVDQILFATGRAPNVEGLGLAAIGVEMGPNGAIRVDREDRTTVSSIYAIGDVTDRVQLTPVATAEGHAFADRHFAQRPRSVSYANIPTAIFANPPMSQVGLTEDQARERFGDDLDVYYAEFKAMRFSLTDRAEKTMMKLVVQASTDRVVGLHMVGQDAPEIVQGFAVAVRMGATKADFDATIGIHPTAAEEFVTLRTKRPAR